MQTIILYSTLGCHLCEQALCLLEPYLVAYDLSVQEVDIADDSELLEKYGISIPVLYFSHTQAHLYWPFDCHQVGKFIVDNSP